MKSFLLSQGFDILQSIMDGYTKPSSPSTNTARRKLPKNNNAKPSILCGMTNSIITKVMHSKSAKEICDKLQNMVMKR